MNPRLLAGLTALAALPAVLRALWLHRRGDEGQWVYGLDDAYIHLAIARTWAETGVWGLHPGQPSSASSSPLWTAAMGLLWPLMPQPDALPWIFGAAALAALLAVLASDEGLRPGPRVGGALVVTLASGAFGMGVLGMEQSAQLVALAAFLPLAERALVEGKGLPAAALAFGATVALRPETFLAAPGILVIAAIWPAHRVAGVAIVAGGSAGAGLFAVVAWGLTGSPIPQSIQAKAALFGQTNPFLALWERFSEQPTLVVSALFALSTWATAAVAHGQGPRRDARWILLGGLVSGLVLQLVLGRVGHNLGRYEAWLALWACWLGFRASVDLEGDRGPLWLAATALGAAGGGVRALLVTILALRGDATDDIARQHLALARFVAAHPPQEIVLNDVGAVSYYGRVKVLDVMGLSDPEVFRARAQGTLTPEGLGAMSSQRHADFAAMYPEWLGATVPAGWVEVGRWETPGHLVAGGDAVAFYAIGRSPEVLEAELAAFRPADGVTWRRATSRPPRPPPAQP